MEETPSNPVEPEFNESLCANCQALPYEGTHPTNLCSGCRTALINYPIPKWIKIFALIVIGIIVVSVIRTQMYLSAAINLGRGEKAIENRLYVTAQRELASVLNKFPDDLTANADFFIAAAYNLDGNAAKNAYQKLLDKNVEDQELFARVNTAMDYLSSNYAQDTVLQNKVKLVDKDRDKLLQLYEKTKDSAEIEIKTYIADCLFDLKDYKSTLVIIEPILITAPNHFWALSLGAAAHRNIGNFEKALSYCDRILAVNAESVYGFAIKSRIELKRKHDQQAAVYAEKAMKIDPEDDTALEAMSMVNYFAGRKEASLANLSKINAHMALNGDSTISKRLTAIINGSEIYR
jgi:tetratricopeptide (TPR) repeat protein